MRSKLFEKGELIFRILDVEYPDAECALKFTKPYELLIATRLSAQCTDVRVNIITKTLFKKYPSLEAFANADLEKLCKDVYTCGFYREKAKSIIEMSQIILEKHDGQVPSCFDDLIALPGVGRKTASLIMGVIYGEPSIIADTHCIRLSNRLGFVKSLDPYKVELALKKHIHKKNQTRFSHLLVFHGRNICIARRPKCDVCSVADLCTFFNGNVKH